VLEGAVLLRPLPLPLPLPLQAVLYMVVKLVLVPLLMVGCAFMVGMDGEYGRAAVLVAALPVSSATFALCKVSLPRAEAGVWALLRLMLRGCEC
jgi:predicted permease